MSEFDLSAIYRGYIACLNARDWAKLGEFVGDDVEYNGQRIGLSGYREMLEKDFHDIPNLRFEIRILVCEPPDIASRLHFDCTPVGVFLGLPVNVADLAAAQADRPSRTGERRRLPVRSPEPITRITLTNRSPSAHAPTR
ncbi:ester cyclase [Paraburkholderia antibiotica]|uniref:SnoaL-like domain-containing protein n=1 Tax=Paraburkholderia antibiotica TaxID=2728839 RepID=A0A7X9X2D1_9BURK|nr:ester cyclase [Paraburkholderia antibiotica]NML30153.1 SnoaL-like domain-containing protein [Paraburkholderia antibiotica]